MPLTGTKKAAPTTGKPKPNRNLVKTILDQLDTEWTTLKQDDPAIHGDEAGLLAYFHVCVRCLLQQVGDPYTAQFPAGYIATERLPKLCAHLIRCQELEGEPLKIARETVITALRASWPAYRDLAIPDAHETDPWGSVSAYELKCLPFTWEAIEKNWTGEDDDPNRTKFLPTFSTQASADFHLTALAVLYLNRQCRYYLTDLKPHQTGDGRA